jgi:predicted DNA binding protein
MTKNAALPSRRAAVKAVAEQLGLSTKTVYNALERSKT